MAGGASGESDRPRLYYGSFSLAKHLEGEVRIFRTSFDEANGSSGLVNLERCVQLTDPPAGSSLATRVSVPQAVVLTVTCCTVWNSSTQVHLRDRRKRIVPIQRLNATNSAGQSDTTKNSGCL